MNKILIFCILLIGCAKNKFQTDITFIKIGRAENKSKFDTITFGSSFFVQTNFEKDSMLVKINVLSDEIDPIDSIMPITLKVVIKDDLKNACIAFINYANQLSNGVLPNAYFEEPVMYDGGTFLLFYVDNNGIEHYFNYVMTNLSQETQTLHNLLMDYYYDNYTNFVNNRKLQINTDSITRAILIKKEIKGIIPFPSRVDPPPIKFVPKRN